MGAFESDDVVHAAIRVIVLQADGTVYDDLDWSEATCDYRVRARNNRVREHLVVTCLRCVAIKAEHA